MKFDEMEIKGTYDSEQVNVYHEFFNKLLPESKMYQRFGGFFSSKNFAHCAQGLQDFIKNNRGKMELSIIPIFPIPIEAKYIAIGDPRPPAPTIKTFEP